MTTDTKTTVLGTGLAAVWLQEGLTQLAAGDYLGGGLKVFAALAQMAFAYFTNKS